jgi:acyl-coenzyme A thioesterase PaaI-like protein
MTLVREHFIRKLGMSPIAPEGEVSHLRIDVGSTRCDLGLVATVADVIGGSHVMLQRAPAEAATTHLEAIAIDRLAGPGVLEATATTLTASKRRAIVEVRFRLGGTAALVHVGFALRAVADMPDMSGSQWREEVAAIDVPLYERIGVEVDGDVARVPLEPHLFNHVEALQGGAMAALLEAAAVGDATRRRRRVAQATVTYLAQARHDEIVATADRSMGDDLVVVDAYAGTTHATRAVMALVDA